MDHLAVGRAEPISDDLSMPAFKLAPLAHQIGDPDQGRAIEIRRCRCRAQDSILVLDLG